MELRRGDIVVVVGPDEMGKPRPAVVVQSNLLSARDTVIVCPLSSEVRSAPDIRPAIASTRANGLVVRSQVMVERLAAIKVERVKRVIGRMNAADLKKVDRALLVVLGLEWPDDSKG